MSDLPRLVLSYQQLRAEAAKFLGTYHPTGTIPVPIETIAERAFQIDIVPVWGLQETLLSDDYGVVGFLTSNLREIHVDEWVYRNRYTRYRFTIAHELGHAALHKSLYAARNVHDVASWKAFINSIPDEEHGWYEWQAHAFAGLVLVPSEPLRQVLAKHLAAVKARLEQEAIPLASVADTVWDIVLDLAAKDFEVSPEVVQKRADHDKLRREFLPD